MESTISSLIWLPIAQQCKIRMEASLLAGHEDLDSFDINSDECELHEDDNEKLSVFSTLDEGLKQIRKDKKKISKGQHLKHRSYIDQNFDSSDSGDSNTRREQHYTIKETDILFAATIGEEDISSIEIYVYDCAEGGMFVHHDFMIPVFPLCSTLVPSDHGILMAVGSFSTYIDIWDISCPDPVEPLNILGSPDFKGSHVGHDDAVMCIDARESCVLSGSADKTICLWNTVTCDLESSFSHHKNKVQCVRFLPESHHKFISACYDGVVSLVDTRSREYISSSIPKTKGEIEALAYVDENQVLFCTDKGYIFLVDTRNFQSNAQAHAVESSIDSEIGNLTTNKFIVGFIKGHEKSVTGLSVAANHSLLLTSSIDKTVAVWDLRTSFSYSGLDQSIPVQPVSRRKLGGSSLYDCRICPHSQNFAIIGGSAPILWDMTDDKSIVSVFRDLPGADSVGAGTSEIVVPEREESNDG